MSDVFVSYKAEDRARVEPLVERLEAEGLSVWWDARVSGGEAGPHDDVSEILWLRPDEIDPERFAFACCRDALQRVVRKS